MVGERERERLEVRKLAVEERAEGRGDVVDVADRERQLEVREPRQLGGDDPARVVGGEVRGEEVPHVRQRDVVELQRGAVELEHLELRIRAVQRADIVERDRAVDPGIAGVEILADRDLRQPRKPGREARERREPGPEVALAIVLGRVDLDPSQQASLATLGEGRQRELEALVAGVVERDRVDQAASPAIGRPRATEREAQRGVALRDQRLLAARELRCVAQHAIAGDDDQLAQRIAAQDQLIRVDPELAFVEGGARRDLIEKLVHLVEHTITG